MNKSPSRLLLIILSLFGWFAIISQLYLAIVNRIFSIPETIVNFFSYFTILINILVATCCTMLVFGIQHKLTKPKSLAAITVYITIVGVTYNLLLRSVWNPEGLQKITDELLHTIIPVLFVIYWIAFGPKTRLEWKDAITWLIYPLLYSVYTLIHGLISNWYPYPFIDPNKIGWTSVAINSVFVLVAFYVVALVFIATRRRIN